MSTTRDDRARRLDAAAREDHDSDQTDNALADSKPKPAIAQHARPLWDRMLSTRPPPRDYLLRLATNDGKPAMPRCGDGWLSTGIPAMLSSEGGVGKTQLVLELAVAIIVGRQWLGFHVDANHVGQRVLVVLAEETRAEVHRRLVRVADHYRLDEDERRIVERQLVVAPLAGKVCSLVSEEPVRSEDGRIIGVEDGRSDEFYALAELLLAEPREPWAFVALDPFARLFPDAETTTRKATNAIQAMEALAEAPGSPLVLAVHHSSKVARRAEAVDARGVTALTDGCRWAATLNRRGDDVLFEVSKSNYGPPVDPILLRREKGGLLRPVSDAEHQAAQEAASEAREAAVAEDARAIVRAVREHGARGERATTKSLLATWGRMRKGRGLAAVDYALAASWIEQARAKAPFVIGNREPEPTPPSAGGNP